MNILYIVEFSIECILWNKDAKSAISARVKLFLGQMCAVSVSVCTEC